MFMCLVTWSTSEGCVKGVGPTGSQSAGVLSQVSTSAESWTVLDRLTTTFAHVSCLLMDRHSVGGVTNTLYLWDQHCEYYSVAS